MIDLYSELKVVVQALRAGDVPYALCGGLALMVYRQPRATVDIDIVLPPEATERLTAALIPLGFRPHPRPMRFQPPGIEILRFYKTDPESRDVFTLDCLLTSHPTVADAWQSRVEEPFEEASISVVSRHGLIALKQLRGSSQDLVDIEALRSLDDQEPGAGEERPHA